MVYICQKLRLHYNYLCLCILYTLYYGKYMVNCLLLKLNRKLGKMFLTPRRESNLQPSDLQRDALTIELPGHRWQREG